MKHKTWILNIIVYILLFSLVKIIKLFYQPLPMFGQILSINTKLFLILLLILGCSICAALIIHSRKNSLVKHHKEAYFMTAMFFVISFLMNKPVISTIFLTEITIFAIIYFIGLVFCSKINFHHLFIASFSMLTIFHFMNMILIEGDSIEAMVSALKNDTSKYVLCITIAILLYQFLSISFLKNLMHQDN